MHTDSPQTFLQNIRKGVDQIQRSNAEKGIVVISLKNQLPHDDYWLLKRQPSLADFICPGAVELAVVTDQLTRICKRYHVQIIDELLGGSAAFNGVFKDTKSVPAVLLHLCTTILIPNDGKPNFHFMRMFCSLNAEPLPTDFLATLESLNNSLHSRFANLSTASTTAVIS